jgi:hypothetical protein
MAGLFFPAAAPAPTPTPSAPAIAAPTQTVPVNALGGAADPYPDDGAVRMPVSNSSASIEAARLRRAQVIARSGRTSTKLVSDAGVRPYTNVHLGGS